MGTPSSRSIKGAVIGSWIFLFLLLCLLLIGLTMTIDKHVPTPSGEDTAMQSLQQFQNWYAIFQRRIWSWGIPAIALMTAFWALWFHRLVQRRMVAGRMAQPDRKAKTAASAKHEPEEKAASVRDPNLDKRLFLHMIGLLQREGRLLDFFSENLENYEDAQIGATVRNIQENCKKVINRYLPLQPVVSQEEGETITLQANFDATAIKLMGQVGGSPPFTGLVRHRGWRVKKVVLPELSGNPDPDIIVPAEVEIS